MRDYDMEHFLMHYGVGRSGGGKTGTNRPKGLHYNKRGSTSLYANRQRQMHGNDDSDGNSNNKFLDIRKNQEKQAKEAKKTKEQIEKYRKSKADDENATKLNRFNDLYKSKQKEQDQIKKYRKSKADDEKWAKVRQEYKNKQENEGKFWSNIKRDGLTKAALANRLQVKRKNEALQKWNDSLAGQLQRKSKEIDVNKLVPKMPTIKVKKKKKG